MQRFGRGNGGGGFSALLRSNGGKPVNKPNNAVSTPGGKPYKTGAKQRVPNDAAIQRHMDAKDGHGHQPGGARISHGSRKAQQFGDSHQPRIARGSAGTTGRVIHHANEVERPKRNPGREHLIGARRTNFSKSTTSKKLGSSGMSPEVGGRPGVPGHQSVINRGIKPHGGYSHAKRSGMARSISW